MLELEGVSPPIFRIDIKRLGNEVSKSNENRNHQMAQLALLTLAVGAGVGLSVSSAGVPPGKRTLSMTCIIPLQAMTSGVITLASFTVTPSSDTVTSTVAPIDVSTGPVVSDELGNSPTIT